MNIAIIGQGKIGRLLTEHLAKENHNIIIIDDKKSVVDEMVNQFDVKGYVGNGASYTTQVEAGIKKFDLLIACTSTDEVNILCCLVAKKLNIQQTIARIRNPDYATQAQIMSNELGINLTLNPDLDTAHEITRLLRFPSALKVETFSNGQAELVEIKIDKDSPFNNRSLIGIHEKYALQILVCAVKRNNDVIIPNGNFILEEGDNVYLTAASKQLEKSFKKLKLIKNRLKNIMIIGGGRISYYLSKILIDDGFNVKIIESNLDTCNILSDLIPNATIINGDGTNQRLLLEEGIETTDAVVTLTGNDETNIIISTFAKSLGCEKVITKVNNSNYDLILTKLGLDTIVSPKEIFANNIIRYVRGMQTSRSNEFKTLYRLVGNRVEASEFTISKASFFTSRPIKDLNIKHNYLLAAIIRKNTVIIPSGKDTLEPADNVVIVTNDASVIDVKDIFEV
jgi:trk system potassium uptake protein TrkA